jgi:hypothetical protein
VLEGRCHCGAVRITIPRRPRRITSCTGSICRRDGALWAYYGSSAVRIRAARSATESYAWGEQSIRFVRCATCGCVAHWKPVARVANARMGVNTRLFDPAAMAGVRVRRFDGAATGKFLD